MSQKKTALAAVCPWRMVIARPHYATPVYWRWITRITTLPLMDWRMTWLGPRIAPLCFHHTHPTITAWQISLMPPLICIAGCTYGNDARLSTVKCLWCRALHHRKCVGGDVYVCDTCSEMPKRISTMNQTIGHLSDMVHTLVENNTALQRTIDRQKGTIDSLEKHVKELVSVQMLQGSNSGVPTNKRNLIIGSSLLRDFDSSKLIQSEVTCIRGGKIQDVHDKLKSNTTTQYNSISIVVGGNDCNSTADAASVEDLAESYRSMVKDAKKHCSDVRIATIPPRNVSEVTSSRIDALNAALVEMCSEDGITLINNYETFKLRDGSINDGYYVQDGVHLNKAASNRLAKNLKVNPKPEHAKDITQSHSYKDALVNKQGETRGRHHNLNAKGSNQYGPNQGLTISHDHENPQTSGSGWVRYHSSVHNVNGPKLDSSTTEAPWTQVSRRRTAAIWTIVPRTMVTILSVTTQRTLVNSATKKTTTRTHAVMADLSNVASVNVLATKLNIIPNKSLAKKSVPVSVVMTLIVYSAHLYQTSTVFSQLMMTSMLQRIHVYPGLCAVIWMLPYSCHSTK